MLFLMIPASNETSSDSAGYAEAEKPRSTHADAADHTPEEAFASAQERIKELFDYLSYYAQVRADAFKVAIRRRIFLGSLILFSVLAASGVIVSAVVLLCVGAAGALSELFGGRAWLGEMVTGMLLVGFVILMVFLSLNKVFATSKAKTLAKYEALQMRQRARYGKTTAERAKQRDRHE